MYKSMVGFWRASLASTCSRRGLCLKSRAGNSRSPKAPKMVRTPSLKSLRRAVSLALVVALCSLPALAGIVVTGTQGLTMTGADGIYYDNVSGLTMTGADALTYQVNGVYGLTMTGADGTTWHLTSATFRQPQGLTMTGADGLTMTGADGLTMTGAD